MEQAIGLLMNDKEFGNMDKLITYAESTVSPGRLNNYF